MPIMIRWLDSSSFELGSALFVIGSLVSLFSACDLNAVRLVLRCVIFIIQRRGREKREEEEKLMPSIMATPLCWRTHSARTKMSNFVDYT